MIRSLYTAATGMVAQQLNLDVIANNLANVNTTGFKRNKADFQDLMYQVVEEPGSTQQQQGSGPSGIQVGLGVRPAAVGKIFEAGDFVSTSNQYDIAIEGDGFLQVSLPTGETAYTRSGALKINQDGVLVTSDGYEISPAITISPQAKKVTIAADGTVTQTLPGTPTPAAVGNLQLAKFQNPAGLRAMGKNLLEETEASGTATVGTPGADGYGTIAQGFLESSNVSVVEEIVQMVTGQRAYEANSKVVQTADQILQLALNVKR